MPRTYGLISLQFFASLYSLYSKNVSDDDDDDDDDDNDDDNDDDDDDELFCGMVKRGKACSPNSSRDQCQRSSLS